SPLFLPPLLLRSVLPLVLPVLPVRVFVLVRVRMGLSVLRGRGRLRIWIRVPGLRLWIPVCRVSVLRSGLLHPEFFGSSAGTAAGSRGLRRRLLRRHGGQLRRHVPASSCCAW